jgi:hypothetical protein
MANAAFAALIPVASAQQLEDEARRSADEQNDRPVIQGLAAHVRRRWETVRDYKEREITQRLLKCHRARNMKYDPDKLAQIKEQGGSEIFMGIVSNKCRTATAWLRDSMLGTGSDKPWSISPTPVPELPPHLIQELQQIMQQNLMMYYQQGGGPADPMALRKMAADMKDAAKRELDHEADKRVERMEQKMEDQLLEGGFIKAMHEFTDDIATFPFAVLKGPAPRKRKKFEYGPEGEIILSEETLDEYERVDPFKFYWAPWGDNLNEIPVIEVHSLTRDDLQAMIGVEGYSDDVIRTILMDFGGGNHWLDGTVTDSDEVTGKQNEDATEDTVDALQLWDSVPGKDLRDWGMSEEEIEDIAMSYPVEVWLVNNKVIKAVLNYDPIGRKPYFITSFEKVPGRLDGNGVSDLCMDAQNMCNAAARSLANNMGISSGPQVGINISRLPPGEDITQMYPWKIWQFQQSEYGDSSPPIDFFQPNSNAQELMAVFDRFLSIADETSGIPRYMTGEHVPGAGRTSSGLSMLISNAGKSIKQVINNIDKDVIEPLLIRKYQRNLRYSQDPDLIGDVKIIAKGATSLVVKEAEAVRKQEFLNLILNSPVAQQIVGLPGAAELLRDMASNLNTNVDRVVPTREQIEQQVLQQQQMQQAMMEASMQPEVENVEFQRGSDGSVTGATKTKPRNLQADGSQKGGRQSNYISSRPRGA